MAIHRTICLSIALSLAPSFAFAEGVQPATLGKVEGILDYCAGVSGRAPSKVKTASVLGQASEKELADARESSEYKDSYDEIKGQLDEVPKDQAQKACGDFAKGE